MNYRQAAGAHGIERNQPAIMSVAAAMTRCVGSGISMLLRGEGLMLFGCCAPSSPAPTDIVLVKIPVKSLTL